MNLHKIAAIAAASTLLAVGLAACGGGDDAGGAGADAATSELSGSVRVDGSSTVQPLAEAAVELFAEQAPDVDVSVGGIGTGDGFERFCRGELQIVNASRAIASDEYEACEKQGITPVEVQVGIDGLTVVANKGLAIPNDCITTAQLRTLLAPDSRVANYEQLGSGFPDERVQFFTPGTESGTFDYFTEAVLETDAEQRTKNVQTSADDNQIVTGIEGTQGALGYVGFAFADAQRDKLKILAVDGGDGCVEPRLATIADGSYQPLSRPLFMYASTDALARPEVEAYLEFVLDDNERVNEAADYVPLTAELLAQSRASVENATPAKKPTA